MKTDKTIVLEDTTGV